MAGGSDRWLGPVTVQERLNEIDGNLVEARKHLALGEVDVAFSYIRAAAELSHEFIRVRDVGGGDV